MQNLPIFFSIKRIIILQFYIYIFYTILGGFSLMQQGLFKTLSKFWKISTTLDLNLEPGLFVAQASRFKKRKKKFMRTHSKTRIYLFYERKIWRLNKIT